MLATSPTFLNSKGVKEVVAKVLDFEDAAQEPTEWPTSPALGVCNLLKRLNLKPSDISRWEINEAFAMVVTVNIDLIKKEFGGEGINVEQVRTYKHENNTSLGIQLITSPKLQGSLK